VEYIERWNDVTISSEITNNQRYEQISQSTITYVLVTYVFLHIILAIVTGN